MTFQIIQLVWEVGETVNTYAEDLKLGICPGQGGAWIG
jgi:hypothetical protein